MTKLHWLIIAAALATAFVGYAGAATLISDPVSVAQRFVDDESAVRAASIGGTAQAAVAQGLRKPAPGCDAWEAYWPNGARPVGRTLVGVRCVSGATQSVFLPVTIEIDAMSWQTTRAVATGEAFTSSDLHLARQSIGAEQFQGTNPLLLSSSSPIGRASERPIPAGVFLRAGDVRDENKITVGETVELHLVGSGFTVQAAGKALATGGLGQSIQIRTDAGKVLTGRISEKHCIEIAI